MTNLTQYKLLALAIIAAAIWTLSCLYVGGYFNDKSVEYNIDFPEVG